MKAEIQWKIAIIGAGNLGHHLSLGLAQTDAEIVQVFSRDQRKARRLSNQLPSAEPINDLGRIAQRVNLIIIAVTDDAIELVAAAIQKVAKNALVVHTSGAMPARILAPYFDNYGSFYPLQSFSINKKVDFAKVPICVYSPQEEHLIALLALANRLSPLVFRIDDQQKSALHVAAVFVNNFSNWMYHIGHQICEKEGLNFSILKPLLLETALKVQYEHTPKDMQTGPARRGDQKTIKKHLEYLANSQSYSEIYRIISSEIQDEF